MQIVESLKTHLAGVSAKVEEVRGTGNDYGGRPAHHVGIVKTEFQNPWPSGEPQLEMPDEFPASREDEIHPSVKRIQVQKPEFDRKADSKQLKATWLGHAGVVIQLPPLKEGNRPVTLLIDPIFAERASPTDQAGPSRRLDNPCRIGDLPQIDLLFISHNHYDHMDADTLKAIIRRGCNTTRFVVPLGVKEWFRDAGVDDKQILEMDWWDEKTFRPIQFGLGDSPHDDDLGRIKVACVPAQHNSARTGIDKQSTLWAGFVVEQATTGKSDAPEKAVVYLAGDTGYRSSPKGPTCPAFKEIGNKYGPVDFSVIPIWRGGTLSFISQWGVRLNPEALTLSTHATPEDAVCIHQDVQSGASLGVHFATFAGSEDEATYPVALLEEACKKHKVPVEISEQGGFGVRDVGETFVVDCNTPQTSNGHRPCTVESR